MESKKHRSVLRGLFTKQANALDTLFSVPVDERSDQQVNIEWELLQTKFNELSVVENNIYEAMLSVATEDELIQELEDVDRYRKRYFELKYKHDETVSKSVSACSSGSPKGKRKFKLPTVEIKTFNGDLKEWLPFWSQFKRIHEDSDISLDDKISYLIQATIPGSKARQIVESFPAVSENYVRMIETLQSRFGREDLQTEVYVRELLKLILSRVSNAKSNLSNLYDNIESQLRSLETLNITSDKYAAILYPLIESCLPEDMIRLWHRSSEFLRPLQEDDEFTLDTRLKGLMKFLRNEVEQEQKVHLATEGFGINATGRISANDPEKKNKTYKSGLADLPLATASGLVNCEAMKCIFCHGNHDNTNCFKAQKLSMEQKRNILFEKHACFRCLKTGHSAKRCRSHLKCVICSKPHVTLICPELPAHKINSESATNPERAVNHPVQTLTTVSSTQVFLQTLRIPIKGKYGTKQVRALIDTGSQRTYILRSTAQKLGLAAKRTETIIHTLFGGRNTSEQRHETYDVSTGEGIYPCSFEALDQPVICNTISPVFGGPWLNELKDLNIFLSDVGDPAPIEILFGADLIGKLYTGQKYLLKCGLVAIETLLGWTLMGQVPTSTVKDSVSMLTFSLLANNIEIPKLWELDIIGISDPTEKATRAEIWEETREYFEQTIKCDEDGRYEVRLPWLNGHPSISDNYAVAKQRLDRTIAKLDNTNLFDSYDKIFQDWMKEGIIEIVPKSEEDKLVHYLPHRPVIKESSLTTRIRPVFDASSHEKGWPSLNQCLEVGPNMIELIPQIILKFRQQRVGVVSDIRKAFLQISVNPIDREFLRFLWKDKEGQEMVYRHRRVVFGVSSSPFLLGATINHHIARAREKNISQSNYSPEVIERLSNSFYVDNCVTSVPDQLALRKFVTEATHLMQEAKMQLTGWESSGNSHTAIPVLGLLWDPMKDCLSTKEESLQVTKWMENREVTKRVILSVTQRVFDPIGFTCPVTLLPKLLLQSLWEQRQGWDIPVEAEIATKFHEWTEQLPELSKINIPRWIQSGPGEAKHLSLHTFADASKKAYSAVIFLRIETDEGVSVHLLAARSRVAPLKRISIPRLELLAATIASRLYSSIQEQFSQDIESYFWSDSSTVLSWIRRQEEWSVFVINRVREIRKLTDERRWYHVPGFLNPADLPSRGCFGKRLVESKWWEGPTWLCHKERWPQQEIQFDEEEIEKERKKKAITNLSNFAGSDDWHFFYFSKYSKLLRMMAWIFRFCNNARQPQQKSHGELTVEEINRAENFVLKTIQRESFEVNCERISSLNPFYDEFELIRLKSRVAERPDSMNFRFPVVLPGDHPVVRKLIMDLHRSSCHVGTQGLLSLLREKYWILGGRRVIRTVVNQCGVCKRYTSKPLTVPMPPLPLNRVRDAKVFEVTGVDFAGPLFLKNQEKVWVCLFTCAIYRAVHLELVSSLSTNNFLQCLRRFVSRRGRPSVVYSDNGTNFVGLENSVKNLDWTAIAEYSSVHRIKWYFNPPSAPWWGGFWERLVGVLKGLLRKTLGRACLGYEDLLTLLCECENIINARPLTYISSDPKDLVALTPAMFLQDQPESGMPDYDLIERTSLQSKLRHRNMLRTHLQRRFRNEYLAQLNFHKGRTNPTQASLGDVVLIGNDADKRLEWPLGKIVELIPGKDGKVRVARLKTSKGQLIRPLQRLYPLETISADVLNTTEEDTKEDSAGVPKSRVSDSDSAEVTKFTKGGRAINVPARFK